MKPYIEDPNIDVDLTPMYDGTHFDYRAAGDLQRKLNRPLTDEEVKRFEF